MAAERTVMFQLPSVLSGNLACIAGSVAGRSWELSAGTFVIGRNDGCDLHLPNEAGVSKVHAKIMAEGDRYMLVDCESRNGTIVNGAPIAKQALVDGDEIRICGCVLRFTQRNASSGGIKVRNIDAPPEVTDPTQGAPPLARPANTQDAPLPLESVTVPQAPPPPKGRILAMWYAGGLAGSLLFGGTLAGVVVFSADSAQAVDVAANGTAPPADGAAPPPPPSAPAEAPPPSTPPPASTPPDDAAAAGAAAATTPPADAAPPPSTPPEPATPPDARAVADAEKAIPPSTPPEDDEPATPAPPDKTAKKPPKKKRAPVESAAAPVEAAAAEEGAVPGAAPAAKSFAAVVDGGKSETLKARGGGKVSAVNGKDGESITKGTVLVSFDEGDNVDDLQSLRDRIASLEGAEDEEAKRELRAAKAKLDALTSSKATPVVAGTSGKLTGFNVQVGEVLKPGEVVGRIVDEDAPKRVRVTVDRTTKPKKGNECTLLLRGGGEGVGTVLSVSGKSVAIDTGDNPPESVERVRF